MKDFDRWNEIKKEINNKKEGTAKFAKEGEVWMISLGLNVGREQDGGRESFSRPALIVKKFNSEIVLCVPLSSKQKPLDFYYNFIDPFQTKVSAVLAQLRLISVKRITRRLYVLDEKNFQSIRKTLEGFFKIETAL